MSQKSKYSTLNIHTRKVRFRIQIYNFNQYIFQMYKAFLKYLAFSIKVVELSSICHSHSKIDNDLP
jgi:hypothetical protein